MFHTYNTGVYHTHVLYVFALGVVAEWSTVMTVVPWPLIMLWTTLVLGTYQLRFVSWVVHVIFSFVHFISLYTLGGLRAFRKPLPYNMYLFYLRIANHILIIKIKKKIIVILHKSILISLNLKLNTMLMLNMKSHTKIWKNNMYWSKVNLSNNGKKKNTSLNGSNTNTNTIKEWRCYWHQVWMSFIEVGFDMEIACCVWSKDTKSR